MATSTAEAKSPAEAESQRLQWFSPAFPVGGYAYSHGIETAIETSDITGPASLEGWISDILTLGAGRNDVILLGEAMRAVDDGGRLAALAELGLALAQSAERRLETAQQGAAFFALVRKVSPHPAFEGEWGEWPYPVAAGFAGGLHGHAPQALAAAYLQSFASNLIAAALRLAIIGQSEAQVRLAGLRPVIRALAPLAETATLDDLGGAAFRADLMSFRHETQITRLFRS